MLLKDKLGRSIQIIPVFNQITSVSILRLQFNRLILSVVHFKMKSYITFL